MSRFYGTGYNALEDYCYRHLAVLVLLSSLPSLDPLIELICSRGASVQVGLSDIQLLRCADTLHSVLNKRKESDISK